MGQVRQLKVERQVGPWRLRLEVAHVCAYRGCSEVATDRFHGVHLCRTHLWPALQHAQGSAA